MLTPLTIFQRTEKGPPIGPSGRNEMLIKTQKTSTISKMLSIFDFIPSLNLLRMSD